MNMQLKNISFIFFALQFVLLINVLLHLDVYAQDSSTKLMFDLALHGIGTAGDNVSQGTGNINPAHPQRELRIDIYSPSNQLVMTRQGTVSFNHSTGRFEGEVNLGSISSNSYIITITTPKYLVRQIPGIFNISSGSSISIPQLSLINGDTNMDNKLDILDYNRIVDCFSSLSTARNCADTSKILATDLNDDSKVEQFDYNLFLRELSVQSGDGGNVTPTPSDTSYDLLPPTNKELESVGLLSVTSKGADPTCQTDSTQAIQQTMNEAYNRDMVTFFPEGEYCISNMLRAIKTYTKDSNDSYELVGSTMGKRPLIRLKANSSSYNNTSSPKPVILMHVIRGVENPNSGGGIGEISDAVGFMQSIRNLDIEVESGNPGAVGIEFTGAQNNSLINVGIRLKSGYAGFSGFIGDNSSIVNITVEGGKYGFMHSTQGGSLRWPTMANVKLLDQTDAAIYHFVPTNFMISGLQIRKNQSPAIITEGNSQSTGNFTILDGIIEIIQESDTAVIANGGNKAIALVNVYTKNALNLIENSQGQKIEGETGWSKISEIGYPGQGINIINGSIQESVYQGLTVDGSRPENLLSKHGISLSDFPSPDVLLARIKAGDSKVVNVKDHGILPAESGWNNIGMDKGHNTSPDVTVKLQELINSGAEIIFFPKGKYIISNTIDLKPNTHLTGIANQLSGFIMSDNWKPTGNNPAILLRTPDKAEASPKLSFFRVMFRTDPPHDHHRAVVIRSGKTVFLDTYIKPVLSSSNEDLDANVKVLMTGNAGGKFYGLSLGSNKNRVQHPGYRHLLIDGTFNPIVIYGPNPEDHNYDGQSGGWGMEIRNAKNVAIFGSKQENHNTLLVSNSQNIVTLALSNYDNVNYINSNNYIGSMYPKFYDSQVLFEEVFGGSTVSAKKNKEIGLFKRGTIDWTAFFP